jgi:hypothetical protein
VTYKSEALADIGTEKCLYFSGYYQRGALMKTCSLKRPVIVCVISLLTKNEMIVASAGIRQELSRGYVPKINSLVDLCP